MGGVKKTSGVCKPVSQVPCLPSLWKKYKREYHMFLKYNPK